MRRLLARIYQSLTQAGKSTGAYPGAAESPRQIHQPTNTSYKKLTPAIITLVHGISVPVMPKTQKIQDVPRQRPVSCRFCRSRKLRCSREAPCSNCVSRGIRCGLEPPTETLQTTPNASESELLRRIRRLEKIVDNQNSQLSSKTSVTQSPQATSSPQVVHLDNDVAWLESIFSNQNVSVLFSFFPQ